MIEPTSEQCTENSVVHESETEIAYAIWYLQMGGYCAKAVAVFDKTPESCVDVYVWHDGDFPFGEESPRKIHHCDPSQFISLGKKLLELMGRN